MKLLNALINLNHPAHYFGIGFFQISAGNALVIILMIILFLLALVTPFPGGKSHR